MLVTMASARMSWATSCPLCAQPAFLATVLDTPANMAWEPAAEAEVKDRYERRLCRALGRADTQLVARIGVTPGFEDLISWPGTSVQQ
jgi:hypothetical protein